MKTMKKSNQDDAVSPVVGVMLMLVVTIIIAAVVAAFAGGLATTTEVPSIAGIQLETYSMETHKSGNFAPYTMTFKHTGGDELLTKDLVLSITYNGATYSTSVPSIVVGDKQSWAVGEKLVLQAPITTRGLSQQDMTYGPKSFDWALMSNGNSIAKGTALTTKNVVAPPATLSLATVATEITSENDVTFTITATSGSLNLKGKTVTLAAYPDSTGTELVTIGTDRIEIPADGSPASLTTTLTLVGTEAVTPYFYVSYSEGLDEPITSTDTVGIKINPASTSE